MHRWPYWNKVTAVVLTILLTGVFSPAFAAKGDPTPGPDRKLDGETLFRGFYFGTGPAARYFPEVWENPRVVEALKNADLSKSLEGQNEFMNLLRQEDATIFSRFGDARCGLHRVARLQLLLGLRRLHGPRRLAGEQRDVRRRAVLAVIGFEIAVAVGVMRQCLRQRPLARSVAERVQR